MGASLDWEAGRIQGMEKEKTGKVLLEDGEGNLEVWTRRGVSGHAVEDEVLMFGARAQARQACAAKKETAYVNMYYCSVRGIHPTVCVFVFGPIVW
jgi:hypothetical protein